MEALKKEGEAGRRLRQIPGDGIDRHPGVELHLSTVKGNRGGIRAFLKDRCGRAEYDQHDGHGHQKFDQGESLFRFADLHRLLLSDS